jgi:hypothetical protein
MPGFTALKKTYKWLMGWSAEADGSPSSLQMSRNCLSNVWEQAPILNIVCI